MKAEENMSETLNPTKIMIEPSFSPGKREISYLSDEGVNDHLIED